MSRKAASWRLHRRTTLTLDDLAWEVNPVLRGWLTYFTVFYPSTVIPLCKRIDRHLGALGEVEVQAAGTQRQACI